MTKSVLFVLLVIVGFAYFTPAAEAAKIRPIIALPPAPTEDPAPPVGSPA